MDTRRDFLKKTAYVAPLVLTVAVRPAFAGHHYGNDKEKGNNGIGNGLDPQPPGNPPINDDSTIPPGQR